MNNDQREPAEVTIQGLKRAADATLHQIAGKDGTELNTEEAPTTVSIRQSIWARDANVLVVPPLSFTMIDIVV